MRRSALLILVCVAALGCSFPGLAGTGVASQRADESYAGERRDIRGVVEGQPHSCSRLVVDDTSYFVIWPRGTRTWELVLPNGQRVREGDTIVGRGALTPTKPLRGPTGTTTYWNHVFTVCKVNAEEVLVLDTAELVLQQ